MPEPFQVTFSFNRVSFPVLSEKQIAYTLLKLIPVKQEKRRKTRPLLNLSLVLDRSASMTGEKITKLRQGVARLLDSLGPQDYLAITLFNEKASPFLESQLVTDKELLKKKVAQLSASGQTAISKGLEVGMAEAGKHAEPGRLSRILLLTDGRTLGDEERCRQLASIAGERNLPLVALGLGDDWNRDLLLEMAQNSQGKADYVATPDAMAEMFSEEVRELQAVAVHNIHILMKLMSSVSLLKAYKVVPRIEEVGFSHLSPSEVSFLVGELGLEKGQSLLLEYSLPPCSPPRHRLCHMEITYDLPGEGLFGQKTASELEAEISYRPGENYGEEVVDLLHRVGIARVTARAMRDAETGKIAEATQKLKDVATRLMGIGEASLAQTALLTVKGLEAGLPLSAGNTMSLVFGTKKLTSSLATLALGVSGASARGEA